MDIQKLKYRKPDKIYNIIAYIIILLILVAWRIIIVTGNSQAQSKLLPATEADKIYDIQTNK